MSSSTNSEKLFKNRQNSRRKWTSNGVFQNKAKEFDLMKPPFTKSEFRAKGVVTEAHK